MAAIMDYLSLMGKMEKMENDASLDKDAKFYQEFVALKAQYNFSATDVLRLLRPGDSVAAPSLIDDLFEVILSEGRLAAAATSITKPLRRYRNPHTGEVVETRGSNHCKLREWKHQYGAEVLPAWREL
ncbi:histone-like nucleoid-structuring protein, MvaT/MvaU family [Pseudomonas sp. NA-150]|uniref:histone-like nucleoid-structuring protein, MvaT/MvaU family n=1 Tax=Pseudomonas sp. NA-150 TaxID=3367525 RepID=UPI0037C87EC4